MLDRTRPAVPDERHRRMAAQHHHLDRNPYVKQWVADGSGEPLLLELPGTAQLIATVERDAFARGVEASAKECDEYERTLRFDEQETDMSTCAASLAARIRALLPKPPRGKACPECHQPGGHHALLGLGDSNEPPTRCPNDPDQSSPKNQ